MSEEVWKDIEKYEGLYQVSNIGRVRSLDRLKATRNRHKIIQAKIKGQLLKPSINGDGYYQVTLSKNDEHLITRIHRLVAQTFIPNKDNKTQVNHINGNKLDNRVENLEWCTCKENILHAVAYNLMKPVKEEEHYYAKKVGKYDKNNNLLEVYGTIEKAGVNNKIRPNAIVNCLKGRSKTSGGYVWKYL